MPQPIIQTNCISSQVSYMLDVVYLFKFMEAIYDYEPGIGTMIEEMCGVFKRQKIKPIITAILDHCITFIPNNNNSLYWGTRVRANWNGAVASTCGGSRGVFVGRAIDNDLLFMHTDMMVGHYIYQNGDSGRGCWGGALQTASLDNVCQNWGLVCDNELSSVGGTRAETNTSMNMIKNILNNQVDGDCCIIFSTITSSYNDNMFTAHGKELVEIVIPRSIVNIDIINNISNNEILNVTEKNFSKVYRGLFVESLRMHLNIPRPIQMSESLRPGRGNSIPAVFDRYYDEYLTQARQSIDCLTQS